MTYRPRPIPPGKRSFGLDVVRGFAVLASIPIIALTMSAPTMTRAAAYRLDTADSLPADQGPVAIAGLVHQLVFAHSALLLFGMVFGGGIALMRAQTERAHHALQNLPDWLGSFLAATRLRDLFGETAFGLHLRRMAGLLVIGLAGLLFVSHHFPLLQFALVGGLLFVATGRSWKPLALLAIVVLGAIGALNVWIGASIAAASPAYFLAIAEGARPALPVDTALEQAYLTGSWLNQISWRWFALRDPLYLNARLQDLGILLGSGLIGIALVKTGWLTGEKLKSRYLLLAVTGLSLGMPLVLYGLESDIRLSGVGGNPFSNGDQIVLVGGFAVALGEMGLLLLLSQSRRFQPVCGWLSAVGRLPLTSFFTVTVFCSLYFYAGKQMLRATSVELAAMVGVLTVSVLVFSRFWIGSCRHGPLEWLWRITVYGDSVPLFRIARQERDQESASGRIR